MKPTQEDTKPWYKQFWPWMLIALPASAVIAGIITIIIATQNSHSMVKEDYYKEGLAINKSIDRQQLAATLNLEFELTVNDDLVTLLSHKDVEHPVIYLALQHPMTEKLDTTLVLNRIPGSQTYQAKDASLLAVNYRIRVYPPDQKWELLDRWHPEQSPNKTLKAQ